MDGPRAHALNRPRWDGRAGRYEAWYVKVNEPARDASAWLRYTLRDGGPDDAVAQVWAVVHLDGSTHARRATTALRDLELQGEPLRFRCRDGELARDGCAGTLGDLTWDLRWEPAGWTFRHLPALLHRLPGVRTLTATPNPDLAVAGTLATGARTWELDDAPGQQGHVWGTKHGDGWAWAHCNAHPDVTWEALSADLPGPLAFAGPLSGILLRADGETLAWRGLGIRSERDLDGWRLAAEDRTHRVEVEVRDARSTMDRVTYTDPDGEASYCHNTKRASSTVRLMERQGRRWEVARVWDQEGATAYELGAREPDPRVDPVLPEDAAMEG